jgi:hypothetical protein
MVRWLQQQGLQAGSFSTRFGADGDDEPAPDAATQGEEHGAASPSPQPAAQ